MQVFIMWAGERSHTVARALKEFLEFVVRGPRYFISDDIEGGRLWRVVLAGQLEAASFGIACLTSDNLHSHWLHFEAGALSKAVGQAQVVPYLVDAKTTDVDGPLSDFQMVSSDEAGTRKLVSLIAAQVPDGSADVVDKSFRYEWPKLDEKLQQVRAGKSDTANLPIRSESALLQEILDRVRRLEASTGSNSSDSSPTPFPVRIFAGARGPWRAEDFAGFSDDRIEEFFAKTLWPEARERGYRNWRGVNAKDPIGYARQNAIETAQECVDELGLRTQWDRWFATNKPQ